MEKVLAVLALLALIAGIAALVFMTDVDPPAPPRHATSTVDDLPPYPDPPKSICQGC